MKEYIILDTDKKLAIIKESKSLLMKEEKIIYAYIFGSFLNSMSSCRDIDIGIYVKGINANEVFDYELIMTENISKATKLPFDIIDVKVLNFAPSHFLNNIFSTGRLLFCRNQELLSDMIEESSLDVIANENIAYQSLKELVP